MYKERSFKNMPDFFFEETMVWIEEKISKKGFFSTDLLAFPDSITTLDRSFLEDFDLFYDRIADFAKSNYIDPNKEVYGESYNITFNNKKYQISKFFQGEPYSCAIIFDNSLDCIDFEKMMMNKKQDDAIIIDNKLDILGNIINSLYDDGIPLWAINDCISSTIDKLESNKGYKKVRIKKG